MDHLGRVYGLVSITTEQLLIRIGHRMADRFFHTREKTFLTFSTEVLLLDTFYPLLSWLLSPTFHSGFSIRLQSQRMGEIFFDSSLSFSGPFTGPKLSSLRRGRAGRMFIFSLPIFSLMLSCRQFSFPHSFLDSSSFQAQELEGAITISCILISFQKSFAFALLHPSQPSLQSSKAFS